MAYPEKQKEFVKWLYSEHRTPATQNELAEQLRISYVTLSRWKQDIALHWRWLPEVNGEQPGTIARYQAELNKPGNFRFQFQVMGAILLSGEDYSQIRPVHNSRLLRRKRGQSKIL